MEIKNVIICGLGALGLTYANKLKDVCNLKILANKERVERYKNNPPQLNDKPIYLDYILPDDNWKADLIIIATKSSGLEFAIEYIKNFIHKNTIIISLINGISSEEKIKEVYKDNKILLSYFIGHSAMKYDNIVYQDGIGKIVLEPNEVLEKFFLKSKIDVEISEDIRYSMWVKLGVNIVLNQLSAINKMTVGELKKISGFEYIADELLSEIIEVATLVGIENLKDYKKDVLNSINLISDDGKTSMLQDVLAQKKTEVDIFSGEIINLGQKYNVQTPKNEEIYNKIKLLERNFS